MLINHSLALSPLRSAAVGAYGPLTTLALALSLLSTPFYAVGAYGPLITLANGTVWNTSYVERPLVYAKPDGTPLVFYTGMGRGSYEDCASWAQRFCTPADTDCGPTVSRLLSDGYEHHPGHGRPFKLPQRSGGDG